jgi:predicted nuclease of restriction endonuclease-like (RecB) superfamily
MKMDNEFFDKVASLIEQARSHIGRTADLTMCATYYGVGRMIVEKEQGGKARAEYGRGLLIDLSEYLQGRFGKGFSVTALKNARKFYQVYAPSIQQKSSAELTDSKKSHAMPDQFKDIEAWQKGQAMLDEFNPFKLSWSHYLILMRIKNEQERRFYEIEAVNQQWDYRRLQREYNSSLYERLALSRDKDAVMRLSTEGHTISKPQDLLKNPLVLEFAGLKEEAKYSEDDLESALLEKLQYFLLEMGKGFLYETRQKRFTFDEDNFWVDLVLYNRLLQCYVLIDLKIEKLKHQNLGQMQMYVHYFDRYVKKDFEKPTIGILLCKEKSDSVVEITLPEGENIYAAEYSLYLPDKTVLQEKLNEWTQEFEDEQGILAIARETAEGDDE